MSDTGTIVTDAEVVAMIPNIRSIEDREKFCILAAEGLVQNYCGQAFGALTVTDERVDIERGEIRYAGMLVHARRQFALKYGNLISFTSLFVITARNSDGTPTSLWSVPKDTYVVDLPLGIVSLITPLAYDVGLYGFYPYSFASTDSWPQGFDVMRASYKVGAAEGVGDGVSAPYAVKMAVIQIISRMYQMAQMQMFHVNTVTMETGSTSIIHTGLTEEEKQFLQPYVRKRFY
jgi:hypothetical protein